MIVKNESHVILSTLENILQYIHISYWVISDTGSTDNTKELIIEFFQNKNIPGELIEHQWVDFAFNRNLALNAAIDKADFLFIFDADDRIFGNLSIPKNLEFDQLLFYFGEGKSYTRPLLINTQKKWNWKGVLHECLCPNDTIKPAFTLEGDYYVESGRTGARSQNPNKYLDDAIILKNAHEIEKNNDVSMSDRYAFYCAQSYKDQGKEYHNDAIEWYEKCLDLNNWAQEKYISCLYLGELYRDKGNIERSLHFLYKSVEYDAERIECIAIAMNILREQNQHLLVNALYHRFKYYKHTLYGKLFLQNYYYYNYIIEFNNSVSAFYVHDKESGFDSCKTLLLNSTNLSRDVLTLTFLNIHFYTPVLVESNTQFDLEFFYKIDNIICDKQICTTESFKLWNLVFDSVKSKLTNYPINAIKPNISKNPNVFISFTTCKRFDLFEQTINSIINHWTDISMIDYWFCVDDNSTHADQDKMKNMYPWIDFLFKTTEQKGHRQSMNLIYDKLVELQPQYWIHMEDDFLFHHKMPYISTSIQALDDLSHLSVNQIVFNRNYAEIIEDYNIQGHTDISGNNLFVLHNHFVDERQSNYINCHYWANYSFRPSMVRTSAIFTLGNFDSENQFFEMDYAHKWTNAGMKTAFFNKITARHIGRLTKDRNDKSKINAYSLNNTSQFNKQKREPKIQIVNLKRRPDRKEATIAKMNNSNLGNFHFFNAIDGNSLQPNVGLSKLFSGNDFGNRRGVIGCAISHFILWLKLLNDTNNDYYVIMEDDFTLCDDFNTKFNALVPDFIQKDVLFLGYHMFSHKKNNVLDIYYNNHSNVTVNPLDKNLYIGGTHCYSINKYGAQKLVKYINQHGIKHGIDYVMKICNELQCFETRPHLSFADWNENGKIIDSDIQNNNESLSFDSLTSSSIVPKKNVCFIHSCHLANKGINTLLFLLNCLYSNKLVDYLDTIFICNIGIDINKNMSTLLEHPKIQIINISSDSQLFEMPTINILHDFALKNSNANILYLHTKGISHDNNLCVNDWTNMMLYFLVKQFKTCLELLNIHDVVGCNYSIHPRLHFSGNFWWANSSHIKTLTKLDSRFVKHDAEWWICTNNLANFHSVHNSNANHYGERYPSSLYVKYKIKMICNWASSEQLCKEWSNMCQTGFTWKNLELTWSNRDDEIDYYVIINKPCDNSLYDPKRTIIFQMEPWVNDSSKNWGVKTWGDWAVPDPSLFFAVRGRKNNCHNNAFWQLEQTLPQLLENSFDKTEIISSICSSKYFDEGHIARIDFLKFIENKMDDDLCIHIFNQDNIHGFRNYFGPLSPYLDKSKGILPYKYYFMMENNYESNFITEKIWEPILCECLVFYYGCPNITDYIDANAFVQLDINDFEKSYQIIKQAIREDWWSIRLPFIRKEKNKILNELAFFPTIHNIITNANS